MALAIRRRGWTLSLALAVAIAGAFALVRTPIDAIPDLSENQQIVHADWPGRDLVTVRATGPGGEVCRAAAAVDGA